MPASARPALASPSRIGAVRSGPTRIAMSQTAAGLLAEATVELLLRVAELDHPRRDGAGAVWRVARARPPRRRRLRRDWSCRRRRSRRLRLDGCGSAASGAPAPRTWREALRRCAREGCRARDRLRPRRAGWTRCGCRAGLPTPRPADSSGRSTWSVKVVRPSDRRTFRATICAGGVVLGRERSCGMACRAPGAPGRGGRSWIVVLDPNNVTGTFARRQAPGSEGPRRW